MDPILDTPKPAEGSPSRLFSTLAHRNLIAALFAVLLVFQFLGYLILGTGRAGMAVSQISLDLYNLIALACSWIAFRRARGAAALFWFLFGSFLFCLLIPNLLNSYGTTFNHPVVARETWRVLYCLYGAPVLMMLFIPLEDRASRLHSEIILDLFQIGIVVALGFTSFLYLPLQQMLPHEAMVRNLVVSNLLSVSLLVAALVRLRFIRTAPARDLVERLATYLIVSGIITFIGNWFDLHHYDGLSAWWYIGWAWCYIVPAMVAVTWTPVTPSELPSEPANFSSFLSKNVALVAVLVCDLMMSRWKETNGALLTDIAVGISLLAFTVRLALTQFHQQQEIAERKAAQEDLSVANETIANLLDDARVDAAAIAQVSQLAGLLQASSSRDEAFRLIPEPLTRLFPGTSGALTVFNASRTHAELVAEWGDHPPSQSLTSGHHQSSASSPLPLPNETSAAPTPPQPEPAKVAVPLLANNEAIGVLTVQQDGPPADVLLPSSTIEFSRHTQMAYAVAEQISLTVANLDLREALRVQAIRDPLTGLYNRRYLQESLEREGHRARRHRRSLALLMLDIDHFKRYNDTYGHAAGDEALRLVAKTLRRMVRAEDLPCRYGGEEFVVLLPDCPLQNAALRAEEIRQGLKDLHAEHADELPCSVTVSIGVAVFEETTDQLELLLKCADDALYQAKHGGRDRVVVAQSMTPMSDDSVPHLRT